MAVAAQSYGVTVPKRSPVLSAQQINAIAVDRFQRFQWRNDLYLRRLSYYLGPERTEDSGVTRNVINMDSKGRPLMRHIGDSTRAQYRYFYNAIAPIVDDYRAIIGKMPRVMVPPEDVGSDGAVAKAEKMTRYAHSTMSLCDMDLQQAEAGFFLPTLGDAVYVLEVDPPRKGKGGRVAITTMPPLYAYPSFKRGFKRFQLHDLVIAYREDPDILLRDYGYEASDNPSSTLLVTYLSPYQRTICIGKEVLAHVEFDLGFCMAEWCFNKNVMQGTFASFAQSDIGNILDLQDFQNWLRGVASDGLIYSTYPITHIQNIQSFTDDQLEVGPGSIAMSQGEQGKITVAGFTADIKPAMQLLDGASHDILTGAGTTDARIQGQQHSSIQTGRGLHAAQGPQATRMDLSQATLGFYLERVFKKVFELQETGPFLGKKFEMHGRYKGRTFREEFDPKEDIDGWYQASVSWDQSVGVNQQQKIQMGAQAHNFGLVDDLMAMEMAGIEDPMEMRKRIEAEHAWRASLPGGGAPDQGAGQGQPPAEAAQGSTAPTGGGPPAPPQGPPQSMIFRPPQMASPQPPPGGVPQGATEPAITTALGSVLGKLKGTVFAAGELAEMGQSVKPEIFVTALADQKWVKQALKQIAPDAVIKYAPEDKLPPEAERLA
jgi:hypothetical protein